MDAIIYYRRANALDVQSLVNLRLAFLAEISGASESDPVLRKSLAEYFSRTIPSEEFIGFVAVADGAIVATSGLVFHRHPPSNRNPTGREAYVMNTYTDPAWRRRGIASRLLQLLIEYARQNNCGKISLHALPKGRSIYVNAGFVPIETEMRLELHGK
ncbi:MAG: GNAT family N-acetyltransferase [Tepidisphaeraceae bacterium]|jgi:GNAT superfamily N-acetyltransferase